MTREFLSYQINQKKSFLCVGLDSDIDKIPARFDRDVVAFNKFVIDETHKYCIAYKPNMAFYECRGYQGYWDLMQTLNYIKCNYPHHFIILDAKRGDIGNTSKMYAKAAFEELHANAVTVAPYMGEDSVSPFLAYEDKWVVLLALTSNKGSKDFQLVEDTEGVPLYKTVLRKSQAWGTPDNMMYVVGATRGEMIAEVRKEVPEHFLLVPGVGAQGGSLEDVVKYGMIEGCGLIVNSSREIIFADDVAAAAERVQKQMEELLIRYKVN